MFKVIGLLKRKPGTTLEDFKTHYETVHAKIGEKYLLGHAVKYARTYLEPMPHPLTGEVREPDYDVVLEMVFPDVSASQRARAALTQPGALKALDDDARRFVDTSRRAMFFTDERESEGFGHL